MIRVVLDTNVLVSANLSEEGLEALVVSLVLNRKIQLHVSEPILQEYERVLRYPRLKFVSRLANLTPGHYGAQPDGGVAQGDRADDIGEPDPEAAFAHGGVGLPFETGERGVAAEEPHHQDEAPVRVGLEALGEQRHRQPDQEAAGDIDQHGAGGEARAETAGDGAAGEITRQGSHAPAEQDEEVLHRARSG